jgi:hypothetical protein
MKNCWEFKKCGREPGGTNVDIFGICPSATEICFNNTNNGKNAGRICWKVAGTLSSSEIYCLFAKKLASCIDCDFYKQVQHDILAAEDPHLFNPEDSDL